MQVHNDPLQNAAAIAMAAELDPVIAERDIEESTDALASSCDTVGAISRNVEQMGNGLESLESYVSQFLDTVPEGDWNGRVARQYQLGMHAVLGSMGIALESNVYSASFEAVGVTQTGDENRKDTEGKSKGMLKRLWDAFVAVIKSFIANVSTFVTNLKNHAAAVKKMGASLKAAAVASKGTPDQTEFEGRASWTSYLQVGDADMAPENAVDKTTDLLRAYCNEWKGIYLAAATSVMVGKAFQESLGVGQEDGSTLTASVNTSDIKKTQNFPGNKTVAIEDGTIGGLTLKVTLSGDAGVPSVKVLDNNGVQGLADAIVMLGAEMEKQSDSLKEAVTTITRLQGKLKQDNMDKISPKVVSALLAKVPSAVRTLMPLATDVAKGAYTHGKKSLATFKAA